MTAATTPATPGPDEGRAPGQWIVRANVIATMLFSVTAVVAAVMFTDAYRALGVVVSLGLFAAGVVAFLWGYWSAVQRSRHDLIGVAALFFLLGEVAPLRVRRTMWFCLGTQVVVSVATALSRPETDGRPGSSLAFGILVPMLGIGLNGLWGADHGAFEPRRGGAREASAEGAD